MAVDQGNILVVDDDDGVLLAAEIALKKHFSSVTTDSNPHNLTQHLQSNNIGVVLLDMNFATGVTDGEEGLNWLKHIHAVSNTTKVILMTAYGGMELAIKAIKQGATDFIVKPWDNDKLLATVNAALQHSNTAREVDHLRNRQSALNRVVGQSFGYIVGEAPTLKEVLNNIEKVAATDASVLILGENGTGKELVARAIHNQSTRSEQAFINVDIGAVAESLFESELFGHKKGAFTDAHSDRPGRFEVASGGTLFLDEIGNINMHMQAKLLGALETLSITRLGSDRPVKVDVRLICATNRPLYEMVENYEFRQDLLYRINTVEIRLPPLRERQTDIPILAEHFIALFAKKYNKTKFRISEDALKKLQTYRWPGNVRELQHALERAVIMSENTLLQADDFILSKPGKTAAEQINLNLEDIEESTIKKALIKHQGNMSKAAQELGLSRATLYRKVVKYGI